jgi:APA family basic amino acid/polyamine antiporter
VLAVHGCLALTLWAFLGLESATIPAGEARHPRRDIPRATVIGVTLAALLYVSSTVAVMGLVPRERLADSAAPFADAARELWGPIGGTVVAAGAFLSCFGALNGWMLVCGQLPMAMARDGLFPRAFARTGARGTPGFALALSSALACALVVASFSESLVAMFRGMLLLATLSSLVPLVGCALADLVLAARARRRGEEGREPVATATAVVALVYGVLAIASVGRETLLWGTLLLAAGAPVYFATRARGVPRRNGIGR